MRHASLPAVLILTLICVGTVYGQAEQAPPPAGAKPQPLSYALGMNIGGNMKANKVKVDLASLMAGIRDGLTGAQPQCTEQEMTDALAQLQLQMQQQAQAAMGEMAEQAQANEKAAAAFLEKNKQRPGVQVTPSGLQYVVLTQGNGPSPTATDTVRCHYRGTLMDGTEFDSSIGGDPVSFQVGRVIDGWTEALQKMRVGDKWQLFVPPNLAYGMDPPGPPLEPNSLLIFEVELLGIEGQ